MTIKLAVIFNENKLSGRLTRLFTGCYAYHVAWVDEEAGKMWDMHFARRRRKWPHYDDDTQVLLFDAPGDITKEYLEEQLETNNDFYGWRDYILFGLRPFFHLFGKSTRNVGGVICSEMVNNDIWICGGSTPWSPLDPPPSPCDLFRWLKHKSPLT